MALTVGERWVNPRTGTSMEVIAPDKVRRLTRPGMGKLKAHYHPWVERFAVESGRATVKLAGKTIELGPGEQIEVPPNTSHLNPYNRGSEDLVYVQSAEPVLPFV